MDELVRESAVPASFEAPPYVAVAGDVAAAYATVDSALNDGARGPRTSAAVDVRQCDGLLTVQVRQPVAGAPAHTLP